MKKNMSKTDGLIRLIIAILILWYFQVISGTWLIILSLVGVIFFVTGTINFCPLYAAFKLRTRKD